MSKKEPCYLIYGLVDPNSLLVRYIGKSSIGLVRPRQHRFPSNRKGNTYRDHWINQLFNSGYDYSIAILEYSDKASLSASEIWWIAYGRALGWPLTNLTAGGDGGLGHKMSDDGRERLRRANLGKKHTPESSERKRIAMRSPEQLARLQSDANPMKRPEVRETLSKRTDWMRTTEGREIMSNAAKAWMHTEQGYETMCNAQQKRWQKVIK